MNAAGRKKKRKKFHATVDVDLSSSHRKIDHQAGSELCVAALQGM